MWVFNAERTSVLLAWHLVSEVELFLGLSPPSHRRKISFDSKQMKLSDILVTSYVRVAEGIMACLTGRFGGIFCVPSTKGLPCNRKSTLKSLEVFCTLHFKYLVVGLFPQRFICTHKAGPWPGSRPHRATCQFQRSREWRHSCPVIHRFFFLWTLQLDIEKSGFDLSFLFFFCFQVSWIACTHGY